LVHWFKKTSHYNISHLEMSNTKYQEPQRITNINYLIKLWIHR
jgi:hypothetical protein